MDKLEVIKDLYLIARKLTYKYIFDPDRKRVREEKELSEQIKKFTMKDFRALRDLMFLLEENQEHNDSQPIEPSSVPNTQSQSDSHFKNKSNQFPDLTTNSQISTILIAMISEIKRMPMVNNTSNLTAQQ